MPNKHLGLMDMSEDESIAFASRCDAMRMLVSILLDDQVKVIQGKMTVEYFCGVVDSATLAVTNEKDRQEKLMSHYGNIGMNPDEAGR